VRIAHLFLLDGQMAHPEYSPSVLSMAWSGWKSVLQFLFVEHWVPTAALVLCGVAGILYMFPQAQYMLRSLFIAILTQIRGSFFVGLLALAIVAAMGYAVYRYVQSSRVVTDLGLVGPFDLTDAKRMPAPGFGHLAKSKVAEEFTLGAFFRLEPHDQAQAASRSISKSHPLITWANRCTLGYRVATQELVLTVYELNPFDLNKRAMEELVVKNVPMYRWVHLAVSMHNRDIDVLVDGEIAGSLQMSYPIHDATDQPVYGHRLGGMYKDVRGTYMYPHAWTHAIPPATVRAFIRDYQNADKSPEGPRVALRTTVKFDLANPVKGLVNHHLNYPGPNQVIVYDY
jgi:hypothetical protein